MGSSPSDEKVKFCGMAVGKLRRDYSFFTA